MEQNYVTVILCRPTWNLVSHGNMFALTNGAADCRSQCCNLLGSSLFSADQITLHSQTGTLPDIERTPLHTGWLGSRVVRVLDSGAEGPGSNRSRYAVG